ncbi:NTPase KAP, partial [Synechocystis salina LEGE 06155]|nr:NTPase KAP [Synechocystis salina LEGE 06155]
DPFLVTQLGIVLTEMQGGQAVGDTIIKGWIDAFMATNPTTVNHQNSFNKPLHKDIQAVFDAVRENAESSISVLDACMEIIESGGWGSLQEMAMRRATVTDFDIIIREFKEIDKFRLFMHRMIEMRLQRSTYDPHFGMATEHFVEACRGIANDKKTPRLARLINRLFAEAALAFELEEPSALTGDI